MIEIIKNIIKIDMLCALTILINVKCVEINEPIVPIEEIQKETYDNNTKSMIGFNIENKVLTIIANWEIGSYESSVNANIYIKERNRNEIKRTILSKDDVDNVIYVNFDKLSRQNNQISVFYTIIDKNMDTIENSITWTDNENRVNIHLDKIDIPYFELFYWQMEVILDHDILRLPEEPGLCYFKKDE